MMLSAGTLVLLVVGVILTRRVAWLDRWGATAGSTIVGTVLVGEAITRFVTTEGEPGLRLLTVLALLGFVAAMITLRGRARSVHWGGVAWGVGGLLVLGQSHDLVVLGLGWELLRHGVRLFSSDDDQSHDAKAALLLSMSWWIAVAGCLLFAGDTDITAIMQVSRQQYWPAEPLGVVHRASLLFVASIVLLVLSLVGAMTLPLRSASASLLRRAACGQLFLQWGAAWILGTLFGTGTPGLSESLTVLLTVLIFATWVGSIRAIGRGECWGEIVDGAVRFHGGLILCATWTLLVPANGPRFMEGVFHSPASLSFAWGQELVHGAIALTAWFAAISWSHKDGVDTDYIDACRGAAAERGWPVVWVLLPLASLIGLPGLWGSWTRLTSGAALLSVQVMAEDELAISIGSTVVVLLGGLFAASYQIRAAIQLVSVLCWEPLIGRPRSPGNGWPQVVAGMLCVLLLVMGFCPALIRTLMQSLTAA